MLLLLDEGGHDLGDLLGSEHEVELVGRRLVRDDVPKLGLGQRRELVHHLEAHLRREGRASTCARRLVPGKTGKRLEAGPRLRVDVESARRDRLEDSMERAPLVVEEEERRPARRCAPRAGAEWHSGGSAGGAVAEAAAFEGGVAHWKGTI